MKTKIPPYPLAMGYRDRETGEIVLAHFTIRCAWCKDIIREGHPDMPISDGMCESCLADWLPDDAA